MNQKVLAVVGTSMRSIFLRLVALGMISFGTEATVHAYTDPGSGAMIWQTLLVAFAGAMFYWRRFLGWIKSKKGTDE